MSTIRDPDSSHTRTRTDSGTGTVDGTGDLDLDLDAEEARKDTVSLTPTPTPTLTPTAAVTHDNQPATHDNQPATPSDNHPATPSDNQPATPSHHRTGTVDLLQVPPPHSSATTPTSTPISSSTPNPTPHPPSAPHPPSTCSSTLPPTPNAAETATAMKIDIDIGVDIDAVYADSAGHGHGVGDAPMRVDLGRVPTATGNGTASGTGTATATGTAPATSATSADTAPANASAAPATPTAAAPANTTYAEPEPEPEEKSPPPPDSDSERATAHRDRDGALVADSASGDASCNCTDAAAAAAASAADVTTAANVAIAAAAAAASESSPLPIPSRVNANADAMDVCIDEPDEPDGADRHADAHAGVACEGEVQHQNHDQDQDQDPDQDHSQDVLVNGDAKIDDDAATVRRADGGVPPAPAPAPVLERTQHDERDGDGNMKDEDDDSGRDLGRAHGDAAEMQSEDHVPDHTPFANNSSSLSSCPQPEMQLQNQTEPKPNPRPKTHADHMRALILRNLQGEFDVKVDDDSDSDADQADTDTDTDVDTKTKTDTKTDIDALTTPWRFVFNTHYELEDETMDTPDYWWMKTLVRYPKGKRLAGGRGGEMWGATLADFYRVASWHDAPTLPKEPADKSTPSSSSSTDSASTDGRCEGPRRCTVRAPMKVVTSSMLRARYAPLLTSDARHDRLRRVLRIAGAEAEGPAVVPVYSIAKLVRDSEAVTAQSEPGGASWAKRTLDELNGIVGSGSEDGERERKRPRECWEVDESWPPESVFSPRAFPRPWTLEPFKMHPSHPEYALSRWAHAPTLQHYIPQHLLPRRLVVHDPWELLAGARWTADDRLTTPFVRKDDVVRVFELSIHRRTRYVEDEDEAQKEREREEARRAAFLACPRSGMPMPAGMFYEPRRCVEGDGEGGDGTGPAKPPVYVVFPPRPPKVAPKEAHLYLSAAAKLGTGNHSIVYNAELDVPRSMLVDDVICEDCVRADVKRILEEEDGVGGERRDPKWDDQSAGRYVLKVRDGKRREVMFGSEEDMGEWDDSHDRVTAEQFTVPDVHVAYEGPYRAVQTTVGYQCLERAPYCEHLRARSESIHPLTARVHVAAKLSSRDDSENHLPKEAMNYQEFPKHFFEHRTGYNFPDLEEYEHLCQSPVPSGAVVPQFYGYYEADWNDQNNRNLKGKREHLSPILLLEDCGQPINPAEMSVDDRNECISLFLRMHKAGWVHSSVYRRNIVRQPGPLSEHPVIRRSQSYREGRKGYGLHWSFRLIDFGRSGEDEGWPFYQELQYEESKLLKWLKYGSLG